MQPSQTPKEEVPAVSTEQDPPDDAFEGAAPIPDLPTAGPLGDPGLTDIYLAALANPVLRREYLLEAGFNDADVNDTLPALEARGMIQRVDRFSWRVLPPDVVLPALATRLEDQARAVRASATEMTRVYEQSRERPQGRDPFEGIQVLTSMAEVSQGFARVIGTAREVVFMAFADSPLSRYLLDQPADVHRRGIVNSSGEPVQVRANYADTLLEDPRFPEMMQSLANRGDELRTTPGMKLTTLVNDAGLALVDLEDPDGRPHGLMISDRAFSSAITEVCRWAWQIAVPWRPTPEGADPPGMTEQEHTIVQMMAAGASDAAIARHLKVSQRTVERRVRAIMDRLNATTRFQAGVIAVRRDLI